MRIYKFLAIFLVIFACSVNTEITEQARYDNYRVYEVIAINDNELKILQDLENSSDSLIFLDDVTTINRNVRIVVAPHKLPDFMEVLKQHEIQFVLKETDLQKQFKSFDKGMIKGRAWKYDWTRYQELADTYDWMKQLAANHPDEVSLVEVGRTYQKRSILAVKISKKQSSGRAVFLEAGIHAREWIAPATATYIANALLTSKDESVQRIAGAYDWYIVPHANPDGYVYSYTTNRMWRKTRTPYGGTCFGADPNRNWGFQWNSVGSSNSPCSDTFAGPKAFSEVETRSMSEFIDSLKGQLRLYISFHAFSQLLLYPFGHTAKLPDNHLDYARVYNASITALKKRYGTIYTGGNIHDAIYPASGASVDWAFATNKVRMSFCYELRPTPEVPYMGFLLPPTEIIPTGEETLGSIVAMVNEVDRLGYFD